MITGHLIIEKEKRTACGVDIKYVPKDALTKEKSLVSCYTCQGYPLVNITDSYVKNINDQIKERSR